MQTFLPFSDFEQSAQALDNQRLNKQTVEVLQIMKVLVTGAKAWSNHPAVRMWRGHEYGLMLYQDAMVFEWRQRGHGTVCGVRTAALWEEHGQPGDHVNLPPWLGHEGFHASHRSNLFRKDPVHYASFGDLGADPHEGYVWPVAKSGELTYERGEGWPRGGGR